MQQISKHLMLKFIFVAISCASIFRNFKTSYVEVYRELFRLDFPEYQDFKTSYVEVYRDFNSFRYACHLDFKTSYVEVYPQEAAQKAGLDAFQNILC